MGESGRNLHISRARRSGYLCPGHASGLTAATRPLPYGPFVRTSDGSIYRLAGGAPIYVSNCALLNGCPGLVQVPTLAWVKQVPEDGAGLCGHNAPTPAAPSWSPAELQRFLIFRMPGDVPMRNVQKGNFVSHALM